MNRFYFFLIFLKWRVNIDQNVCFNKNFNVEMFFFGIHFIKRVFYQEPLIVF